MSASVGTTPPPVAAVDAPAPPPAASEPATPPATAPAAADPLADVTIPARPAWMDRYAKPGQPSPRFFDIDALMAAHGLTRDRAIELQNHFRDLGRSDPGGSDTAHFDAALAKAKAGSFEDRRDTAKLASAPFVVLFDLDDTLYAQGKDLDAGCRDYEVAATGDTPARGIKLAPGAAAAIDRIAALGGAVVIFTAFTDDATLANLHGWQFGGKPLPEHPAIAGVLTNSHLVLQPKREVAGKLERPIIEPSKDVRIVDEALRRAILVDDNPLRTFQPRNVRVTKKFDARRYCTTKDAKEKLAFERTLPLVVSEIEESLRYAKDRKVDFAVAYLPYTQIGALATAFLQEAGMSRKAAIAHLRQHPELVDRDF
ncbi:MAG: hypothetical protein K1X88_16120 [Nannocystaceae bacterium]|nr:hypothetical protein [Nannocystaceae bacterium]